MARYLRTVKSIQFTWFNAQFPHNRKNTYLQFGLPLLHRLGSGSSDFFLVDSKLLMITTIDQFAG